MRRYSTLAIIVLAGLVVGGILHLVGADTAGRAAFAIATTVVLVPLAAEVAVAVRHGRVGVDLIALLAMLGSLLTGEYLAGTVVALMLSGGNALEEYAQGRAGRELRTLVERAPVEASVRRGSTIETISAEAVNVDDIVVVRAGEIVPVDGVVAVGVAVVDEAALTGEAIPVERRVGDAVMSGSANAGEAFDVRAIRPAAESMYASIVRLVQQAISRRAPMVRLADRYSVVFLVATLVMSAGAWVVSGDPVRALAVLVIATPCPLILAPPVALVAGTSRAAHRGVIVKGGGAIERLGSVEAVLVDKTGTLTLGAPAVRRVVPQQPWSADDVLRMAGAVEQLSLHAIARSIVSAAVSAGTVPLASGVEEIPGHGIRGVVDGHSVAVGSRSYLSGVGVADDADASHPDGVVVAHVAIDGTVAGTIELADTVRPGASAFAQRLAALGVRRIAMVTGDHEQAARRIADQVGIDEIHANATPDQKLQVLAECQRSVAGAVVMVGDGVNDAPALAAADVGIAMGSAGASAASDTAQAVVMRDDISLVADAIAIGRRSRSIAVQSVIAGMTLSMIGMVVAAAGYLPPVYGALAQEVIDLAVIVNALRALTDAHRA